jgi:hypothetical protein
MTTIEVELKRDWMEAFNNVTALYSAVKHNNPRPVMYDTKEADSLSWGDTIAAFSLDFSLDVEIKAKRLLGESIYLVFLRVVFNDSLEILPEYTREALGKYWASYGLGPEGTYRRFFAAMKNDQMRSYLKGVGNGRPNDGVVEGIEPSQFN